MKKRTTRGFITKNNKSYNLSFSVMQLDPENYNLPKSVEVRFRFYSIV